MRKKLISKWYVAIAAVLMGAVAGFLWEARVAFAVGSPSPVILEPASSVSIPEAGHVRLRAFVANPTGIYFLLSSTESAVVLHLDTQKNAWNKTNIPCENPRHAQGLAVDHQGNLAVLIGGQPFRLVQTDHYGNNVRQVSLGRAPSSVAFMGGNLLGLDSNDSVILSEPEERAFLSLNPKARTPSLLVPTSNGVAVLESAIPAIRFITDSASVAQPEGLSAPEIQGVMRDHPASANSVEEILFSAASDESGKLFFAVSPYSAGEGARIIEFSPDGKLVNRFRCRLPSPNGPGGKSNPGGQILVSHIGVEG